MIAKESSCYEIQETAIPGMVEGNNGDNDDGNYVYECFIFYSGYRVKLVTHLTQHCELVAFCGNLSFPPIFSSLAGLSVYKMLYVLYLSAVFLPPQLM